jgi:hypothetical protein
MEERERGPTARYGHGVGGVPFLRSRSTGGRVGERIEIKAAMMRANRIKSKVKVKRVSRSLHHTTLWCLGLMCGHNRWVVASRKPTAKQVECVDCKPLSASRT